MSPRLLINLKDIDMIFYQPENALHVLDQINLTLHQGEIIGLLGPSGSGKSTILNILSGILKPTAGELVIDGEIGYMFQQDQLLEWRTIYNNILLGLEIKKTLTPTNLETVDRLLKSYGLWDFRHRYPSQLSGGMRQRAALIRTLAVNPDILLLDEPFSSLDFQTRLLVSEDIYTIIRQENKATILVTHDIAEAISMADTIYVLGSRPASIRNIHPIKLTIDGLKTPLNARKAPEFQDYFDLLWKELI